MLRASTRIICSPSRSCATSAGVLPWTMGQYREEITGISEMVRYFRKRSSAAVVPARRAETTQAPGLSAKAPAAALRAA